MLARLEILQHSLSLVTINYNLEVKIFARVSE